MASSSSYREKHVCCPHEQVSQCISGAFDEGTATVHAKTPMISKLCAIKHSRLNPADYAPSTTHVKLQGLLSNAPEHTLCSLSCLCFSCFRAFESCAQLAVRWKNHPTNSWRLIAVIPSPFTFALRPFSLSCALCFCCLWADVVCVLG